jgi:hypothetical protein
MCNGFDVDRKRHKLLYFFSVRARGYLFSITLKVYVKIKQTYECIVHIIYYQNTKF